MNREKAVNRFGAEDEFCYGNAAQRRAVSPSSIDRGPWFSLEDGKAARDEALGRLSATRYAQKGLEVAARVCFEKGHVTADDVRAELGPPPSQGPMGAIFQASGFFVRTGNTHTKAVVGHARVIGRWMLSAKGRKELRHFDPNGGFA